MVRAEALWLRHRAPDYMAGLGGYALLRRVHTRRHVPDSLQLDCLCRDPRIRHRGIRHPLCAEDPRRLALAVGGAGLMLIMFHVSDRRLAWLLGLSALLGAGGLVLLAL